ncbi:hypothetical protein NDU88_009404 [Pleurodeles waltl]|uniref:Uncharacterized protein n=1 Tax=Pleurodeles waltl TaxID=8319 RepID=A0AAV7QSK3_PLEWA|nr:hypothetical protein NDU88_009404 [Pleurodeles waltl]
MPDFMAATPPPAGAVIAHFSTGSRRPYSSHSGGPDVLQLPQAVPRLRPRDGRGRLQQPRPAPPPGNVGSCSSSRGLNRPQGTPGSRAVRLAPILCQAGPFLRPASPQVSGT